ncbi:MAG: hypothetical protein JRE58_02665 [Deltaproteobacteria bacterium]|nr:hypothetical protein [Deltaproteobacteria bacterium]MBW2591900.1 hypothetical protein [Deltaproteobacteria bacterium]
MEPGSKVLGLGCGEGDLLHFIKTHRQGFCTGIEINEKKAASFNSGQKTNVFHWHGKPAAVCPVAFTDT